LVALIAAAAAACSDDPVEAGPDGELGVAFPDTLPVLGRGEVRERFTGEVAARGSWAYTTTWSTRGGVPGNAIKIWNISSDVPLLVDSLIVESATTLGDVQISDDGRLLVVATERREGSIVIHDLANPARPERLARFISDATRETGVHTVKLARVDGRQLAFLSVNPAPPRLVIVDITNPASPAEVLVREMGTPFIHDVFVRDGLLFTALWDQGLSIWDIGGAARGAPGPPVAVPENPLLLGNVETVGGNAHNVWWFHDASGGMRYAFVGEEAPGVVGATTSGDIHVVDVSDPRQPREVAFYTVPSAGAHNFTMDEAAGVLYAAYYNGGVRALDVRGDLGSCSGDQRVPDGRCDLRLMHREVAVALQDQGAVSIWGVAKVGNRLYASDMLSGLFAIDVSPVLRGR
jgi:hypothetical protein